MSLKTWKAEFYPVPAGTTTNVEACKHSLRKWRGRKTVVATEVISPNGLATTKRNDVCAEWGGKA